LELDCFWEDFSDCVDTRLDLLSFCFEAEAVGFADLGAGELSVWLLLELAALLYLEDDFDRLELEFELDFVI